MPVGGKLDRQKDHIMEPCMEKHRSKQECERMAWAVINKQKKKKKGSKKSEQT